MDTADTIIVVLIVGIIIVFGAYLVLNSGNFTLTQDNPADNITASSNSVTVNNSTTTHTSTSSSSSSGSSSSGSSNSNPSSSSSSDSRSSSSSDSASKSSSSTPQAGQAEGTYDPTDFD